MNELKSIFAKKLIKLRQEAGLTQTELGNRLSYSDKTISKWERAEAMPDASVLKKMSQLFGVTVDELLGEDPCDNTAAAVPKSDDSEIRSRRHAIARTAIAGIWTLAVLIFAIFWIAGSIQWIVFLYAVPASLVVSLVLNSVWNGGKGNYYIISSLVLTVIVVLYLTMLNLNPWQLFLVIVPAELVVYFGCRIYKSHK